ncbi:AcaB family transcriptional regulator [Thiorhodococcus minor]|uniref:DUF1845 domain-containing protein n=1 Tax=Thiorhodococcus minor TaxID=57489 RepID=A0A6M0JXC4_9GAMM|nr:AcaB family transcriptional regulator [Thiorhodococcus minor]NEV61621.1 DUF1845 domain-containing protein [Thiorhodococcus minor]
MAIEPSEATTPAAPPQPPAVDPGQPPAADKVAGSGRSARAYRHSRPVFDRQIRIHSEYARRLVSLRQFRPTMTALYGIDVILRIVATDEEADQFERVITQRLEALSEALVAERERLQLELERHDLLKARPRYTHPVDLKVQIASPHIGAYTHLILEVDQLMIAIDTLWLSGLLSSKARTEIGIRWRNQLGRAAQSFIELHRYAYDEAKRRGQSEAVDNAAREVVTATDEDPSADETDGDPDAE